MQYMNHLCRLPDKEENKYNIVLIDCPKCGKKGLMSIYLPMCTACANEERTKSGEIKE
jgi:hypothetical protein